MSFLAVLEENCPGDDAHDGAGDSRPLLERCGLCRTLFAAHEAEVQRLRDQDRRGRAHTMDLIARELGLPLNAGDLTVMATLQTRLAAMKQMQEIINSHSRRIEHLTEEASTVSKCLTTNPPKLATYIVNHLRTRNGGELDEAFGDMKVWDYELLVDELELILKHGGKPPTWVDDNGRLHGRLHKGKTS